MGENSGGGFPWKPGNPGALDQFAEEQYSYLIISDREGHEELKNLRHRDANIHIPQTINQVNYMKKLNNGKYLIKVPKSSKTTTLQINTIQDIPVIITEFAKMNQCQGTVKHKAIPTYSDEELLEDLRFFNPDANIIKVEKQKYWENKTLKDKDVATITFDHQTFPKKVSLYMELLPVILFVPKPYRCSNCWSLKQRNSKARPCNLPSVCGYCAGDCKLQTTDDTREQCPNNRKCINCSSTSHSALSNTSPKYEKEKEYLKKAAEERLSYRAAKDIIDKHDMKIKQQQINERQRQIELDRSETLTRTQTQDNQKMQSLENKISELTTTISRLVQIIIDTVGKDSKIDISRFMPDFAEHSDDDGGKQGYWETGDGFRHRESSKTVHTHTSSIAETSAGGNSDSAEPREWRNSASDENMDFEVMRGGSKRTYSTSTPLAADTAHPETKFTRRGSNNNPPAGYARALSRQAHNFKVN